MAPAVRHDRRKMDRVDIVIRKVTNADCGVINLVWSVLEEFQVAL